MPFNRREYIETLRAGDPHGRLSGNDLERMANLEQLDWDIHDAVDVGDLRYAMIKLLDHVRSLDARR